MNNLLIAALIGAVAVLLAVRLHIAIRRTARKLRALARVLNAAAEWAAAERELRVFNNRPRPSSYPDLQAALAWDFDEQRIVTNCDFTENVLLETVQVATEEGLNLRAAARLGIPTKKLYL